MEELAKKLLHGRNLVFVYDDETKPYIMENWYFMGIYDGMARFFYGSSRGYKQEVHITAESLFQLEDKGFVKYQYGTLKYL